MSTFFVAAVAWLSASFWYSSVATGFDCKSLGSAESCFVPPARLAKLTSTPASATTATPISQVGLRDAPRAGGDSTSIFGLSSIMDVLSGFKTGSTGGLVHDRGEHLLQPHGVRLDV